MIFRRLMSIHLVSIIRNYCQKPRIPNKIGDQRHSSTESGAVVSKDNEMFHAIGAAEELLCSLGMAKEHARDANHQYCDKIKRIQTVIIELTTAMSGNKDGDPNNITDLHIKEVEDWIKIYANELPPPEHYILPGSGLPSVSLQWARSVCRKVERHIIPIVRTGILTEQAQIYLKRLSSFLFVLSRIAAKIDKQNEHIYVPKGAGKGTTQEQKELD